MTGAGPAGAGPAAGCLQLTARVLSGLTVNVERMRENLHRSAGAICSEAVMIRLDRLLDPANHLGHAARLVDDVLSAG